MKKIILFFVILFLFGLAPHVLAAEGFVPLAPITGLTDPTTLGSVVNSETLANFFNNLYKYLIGIAAVLAVIEIIWGGLEISTPDSVYKNKLGKERIYSAIFGLVLVLSPVLVFSVINPNILNLSINMQPLDTSTATTGSGPGTGPGGTQLPPAPATGCTPARSGPYLETAVCAGQTEAAIYPCKNGLTLRLPACKVSDAASGKCLDTSTTVYCAGKNMTLVYYAYTTLGGLKLNINASFPVPRDAGAANTFTSSCTNDGGVVDLTLTSGATLAVQGISGLLLAPFYTGCSSDYGSIPVNSGQYSGAQCFSVVMSCNPPK